MGVLRTYQEDLVQQTSRSWRTGHRAPCIVLPCGGGKSVIVAEIARRTTGEREAGAVPCAPEGIVRPNSGDIPVVGRGDVPV